MEQTAGVHIFEDDKGAWDAQYLVRVARFGRSISDSPDSFIPHRWENISVLGSLFPIIFKVGKNGKLCLGIKMRRRSVITSVISRKQEYQESQMYPFCKRKSRQSERLEKNA